MLKGFIKSETLEKLGFEKQGILYWKDLYAIEEDKVDTEQPIDLSLSDTEGFDYMTKDGLYLIDDWVHLNENSKTKMLAVRYGSDFKSIAEMNENILSLRNILSKGFSFEPLTTSKSDRVESLKTIIKSGLIKQPISCCYVEHTNPDEIYIYLAKNDDHFAVTTYINYNDLYKKLGYPNSGEE